MKKRKLFSNADGSTFREDISDISEEVKAFFNHLPLELKKLLPIAEDIVRALQNLDDMLEEGHYVNEALEKVLAMTKTEVDDKLYEVLKVQLNVFAAFAEDAFNEIKEWDTSVNKKTTAVEALIEYENVEEIKADTAIQLAVYAVKS